MTMNPEIKAEWVKRLRSGEYEQGKQWLNKDGKFCCLGVLCEIGVERGELVVYTGDGTGSVGYLPFLPGPLPEPSHTNLPRSFSQSIGLGGTSEPIVAHEDGSAEGSGVCSVAVLNDEGSTFAEIADLIEEQL